MEFNFTFPRLLFLVILLGGFGWLGGFQAPEVSASGFHSPAAARKAWSYCVLLFVIGAASATVVDHTVGLMDPTSLRGAYIPLGVGLMTASVLWLRSLRQGTASSPKAIVVFAIRTNAGGLRPVTSPPA